MISIKERFNLFHKLFAYLDIRELIENFAVFEGLSILNIRLQDSVFENIENIVVKNYLYMKDMQKRDTIEETILQKLALGDRKQYALYRSNKQISQTIGRSAYKKLYSENIIEKEKSREVVKKREKHKMLKKELRGYVPEDKMRFTKNFDRFWYTFVAPFKKEMGSLDIDNFRKNLYRGFDKFVSYSFEELSNELIKEKVFGLDIVESGGYWDKKDEFDILAKDSSGDYIVGECKWTNQKICKNILNKLTSKAKKLDFPIKGFALFSKNGFSSSLLKNSEAILFELKDFKALLDDR